MEHSKSKKSTLIQESHEKSDLNKDLDKLDSKMTIDDYILITIAVIIGISLLPLILVFFKILITEILSIL
ncbi:MAG: hypothetical protein ACOCP8_07275 [archaeon]